MSTTVAPRRPAAPAAPTPPSGGLTWRQRLGIWDFRYSPYLYISPFFVLFGIVGLFPLVYTFWVSLHEWSLIGGKGEFVGLGNYTQVIAQDNFWVGLRNTFSIFLLSGVTQTLGALLLAAVLNQNIRAKTFWRMGVLLPFVVAPVAVGVIFSKMFADQAGLINTLLEGVGLPSVGWHSDVLASHVAIATMVNFRWTGYVTLIFLAAMQAIPKELYEAAMIDGAGRVRQFLSVTVPMLRPTIIFVVITATIGGLQIFDEPRVFDQAGQGGSSRQWMTVTMYIYELGWGAQQSFGRAAAVSWILFLIIIGVGVLNYLLTRRIATGETTRTRTTPAAAPLVGTVPAGTAPAAATTAPVSDPPPTRTGKDPS
ncbi:carbohydrate ABC transporter permease [Ornithinimicrobium sediminis]|uniref:carbohydrate ABC transporter permease n=1 Tax=Ornithinimicrobium sediminis TaxID=2904603 RepID=UPI001E614766|nr:sugar ABC transporter permease [Ornithinimicrobium sediminis]MCE0486912.1 sugar ABC transporter permease [Ornithinimicrobium sediminis]